MEAPSALGVSDDFFRQHIARELRWVRRGSKKVVSVAELERWLEREAGLTLGGESVIPSVCVTDAVPFRLQTAGCAPAARQCDHDALGP